jgi:hypothetical protein
LITYNAANIENESTYVSTNFGVHIENRDDRVIYTDDVVSIENESMHVSTTTGDENTHVSTDVSDSEAIDENTYVSTDNSDNETIDEHTYVHSDVTDNEDTYVSTDNAGINGVDSIVVDRISANSDVNMNSEGTYVSTDLADDSRINRNNRLVNSDDDIDNINSRDHVDNVDSSIMSEEHSNLGMIIKY